jgi:hypothetical protein
MFSCNSIYKLMRILSAAAILWGFSGFLTSAEAHQAAGFAATGAASISLYDTSKSEDAPVSKHEDHQRCASAGHMCHAGAMVFPGLAQWAPSVARIPIERLTDRRSSRLVPPLHKPPIQMLGAHA